MSDQRGFSLLEVLVAAALLATALLGLAALAVRGLEDASAARDELVASILLRDLEGRVRLTGGAGAWRTPTGPALAELAAWRGQAARRLPAGDGAVCRDTSPEDGRRGAPACDGSGPLLAKVFWRRGGDGEARRRTLGLEP